MSLKSVGSDPNVPSLVSDSTKKDKSYGRVREAFLRVASSDSLCRFFCKGRQCKYCNPALLPDELKTIDGFYSTWVTDDILAFARPSAVGTEMPELIDKLGKAGIKAIFNLQLPFEHRHCGQPLTEHGFSYDPEQFMEQGVAHYNFGWPDFGVIPVNQILNIVKVMQHSLEFGGKIAVHCHAGLGRTGMTICCFLIWTKGWTPQEALEYVRKRRPGSVQTPSQQAVVTDFYNYVESLRPIFDTNLKFDDHLKRQALILGGPEARTLKYIPKIILVTVEMLLELFGLKPAGHMHRYLTSANLDGYVIDSRGNLLPLGHSADDAGTVSTSNDVNIIETPRDFDNMVSLVLSDEPRLTADIEGMKEALNKGNFDERWLLLIKDANPVHYLCLLGDWLLSLKSPLLDRNGCMAIAAADYNNGVMHISGDQVSHACLVAISYICHAFAALSQQHGKAAINNACALLARWFTQHQYEQEASDMAACVLQAFMRDSCSDDR